ncbi:hypothetical protein REPUB_Repub15cG0138400 [Reevesia pubescens]
MARYNPKQAYWKKVERVNNTIEQEKIAEEIERKSSQKVGQQSGVKKSSYLPVLTEAGKEGTVGKLTWKEEDNTIRATCNGSVDVKNLYWLQMSVIGTYKGVLSEELLIYALKNDGLDKKKLNNHFEKIRRWSEESEVDHRITWLVCYGVPAHLWTLETFQNIGRIWGDFLRMDETTLNLVSFSRGCLQIATRFFDGLMN